MPTLACAIDYPDITMTPGSTERALTWVLPEASLATAFAEYLSAELPELVYTVRALGDGAHAVSTHYDLEHLETMMFVIYLVGELNARQLALEYLWGLGDDRA